MLGEYLWHTRHYELTLRWTFPGRSMLDERQLSAAEVAQKQVASANEPVLIEVLTDSDWAGAADRISTSSCHVFVNGNLAYAFVRKQGCVSLSSCEAELVSAVSGTAEGLYIAHVIRTAGACTTRIVLRLDSSSARSLLYKQEYREYGISPLNCFGFRASPKGKSSSQLRSQPCTTRAT